MPPRTASRWSCRVPARRRPTSTRAAPPRRAAGRAPCTTRPASCPPAAHLAVLAWLGYDTPSVLNLDVLTAGRAGQGARALRPLVSWLGGRGTGVALLCHGYGTVVCGRAARKREPADGGDRSRGVRQSRADRLHGGVLPRDLALIALGRTSEVTG